jgi:DNA-3-methyladenine glycosylase II
MWEEAEHFLLKDKYLGPLVKKYGHCSLKARAKKYYFEDLVDAIVQQQLSMSAATSIFNRIKQTIAERGDLKTSKHKWREGNTLKVNITPEKILTLSNKEFRKCGLSSAKTLYLKDLAKKALGGELQISRLNKLSDDEIVKELISVKGIGVWTTHMFLMFSLARPDIFASGDLGLRNAFGRVVKGGLNQKQMDKFALRWRPYRTIASWYIWKSTEND